MKKEFEKPLLTIIYFINDDIITGSGEYGNDDGELWGDDPDEDPEP